SILDGGDCFIRACSQSRSPMSNVCTSSTASFVLGGDTVSHVNSVCASLNHSVAILPVSPSPCLAHSLKKSNASPTKPECASDCSSSALINMLFRSSRL